MPQSPKLRCIAVLGIGTAHEKNSIYQQALQLGQVLAQEGFSICHGGYGGVMEAVAKGCRSAGGQNTGITIMSLSNPTPGVGLAANPWADAEIRMPSWKERLFKLIEMGDAYVFLDGATGTLNELFFVWEMANKKLLDKPILLLGKRLHGLMKYLKKDPSLKIPHNLRVVSSIAQTIKLLRSEL
jgi:hypothetical protein